jgi:glycosyltransferase involved in cell wall biosynthesis
MSRDEPGSERRPPLSVVVVTRDRPEMLDRALAAVRRSMSVADELVVVDSASRDATAVSDVARRHGARLVRSERPGETVARNLGWRAAEHDLIAYTDDDVWVDEGWADAFARCLGAHPEAAFVTGRVDIPQGQGTLAVSIKDDPEPAVFDGRAAGVIGHSASLVVRRSTLLALDGFDELLGPGGRFHAASEIDLFDRSFARGMVGRYEPAARAWHDQWRRIRDYVRLQHRYGIGSGARCSKLARSDRARLRVALRSDLWRWGVASVPRELAARDWYRALGTVMRLLGVLRGAAAASRLRVEDGHLRP